jgi:hypothetical protein
MKRKSYESPELKPNQMRVAKSIINSYLGANFELVKHVQKGDDKHTFFANPELALSYTCTGRLGFMNSFEIEYIEFEEGSADKSLGVIEKIVGEVSGLGEDEARNMSALSIERFKTEVFSIII